MSDPAAEVQAQTAAEHSERARRVIRIVFILFCMELGLILVFLPWTLLWDNNFFLTLDRNWAGLWMSSYTRGAVSGLGLLNLWIALQESLRLWR